MRSAGDSARALPASASSCKSHDLIHLRTGRGDLDDLAEVFRQGLGIDSKLARDGGRFHPVLGQGYDKRGVVFIELHCGRAIEASH
jgi:hypothetical protein